MIEADIEAAAKDAIAAVLPEAPADITGAWDVVSIGEVKGMEKPGNGLHLAIVASPRAFDSFSTPTANIQVDAVLKSEASQDVTGSRFRAAAAAILDCLQTWHRSISAARSAFSVEGFALAGLRVGGGAVSQADGVWLFSESFTLRGVIN